MTTKSLRLLPHAVLTAALVLAAIFACSEDTKPPPAPTPSPVQVQAAWQNVRSLPGHQVHVTDRQLACEACHTLTDTTFDKPSPESCRSCHEEQSHIKHASFHARERFGPDVDADCTVCHAFTEARPEAAFASPWDCERCHTKQDGTGDSGVIQPGHMTPPERTASQDNAASQGNTMAQDNTAQPGNMWQSSGMATTALVAHASADCRSCHIPHAQPPAKAQDCPTCHTDISLSHGATPHGTSMACAQCHTEIHAPASAAKSCQDCHEAQQPVVASATALFGGGHDACTTCHVPHEFAKDIKTCEGCHTNQPALAAARVKQHNDCRNCHSPHNVRANPNQACKSCHSSLKNDHPPSPSQHECTTCHQGHPSAARSGSRSVGAHQMGTNNRSVADAHHTLAKPCSSCHEPASDEQAFHGTKTACVQCHKPHQFKLSLKQRHLCQACHAEQLTLTAQANGHHDCQACHTGLPHDVTSAPVGCDSCHQLQTAAATAGHQACNACHEPHSGTITQDCSSCHQAQHQTAPSGHRNCRTCHDAHSGNQRSNLSCSTCHAPQTSGAHGNLQTGCTTCHRPHGPTGVAVPPDCASCHTPRQLPALHGVKQHQNCGQCHMAHDTTPFAQRDTCLSCHTNMKDHFPTTERCSSCHLFKAL